MMHLTNYAAPADNQPGGATTNFCPNCGQPVSATDTFCENCGYNLQLSQGDPTQASQTQQNTQPQPAQYQQAAPQLFGMYPPCPLGWILNSESGALGFSFYIR